MKLAISKQLLQQRGFTLVELMIALVLGLLVSSIVIQVYLSGVSTYRYQRGLSTVQENGRFAIQFLTTDLRMAGYPEDLFAGNAITGTDGAQDTVTVSYSTPRDCVGNATGGGTTINLYSIVNGNLTCTANGVNQILVEGVQSLQVLYGEDIDNPGDDRIDRYVNATDVADWNKVMSLRVSLLVTSIDAASRTPEPFTFDGAAVTPNDRLLRRNFVTTITLRNRISEG